MGAPDYNKEKYYSVTLRLPKDSKGVLQELAKKERRSITKLFMFALEKQYDIDLNETESQND